MNQMKIKTISNRSVKVFGNAKDGLYNLEFHETSIPGRFQEICSFADINRKRFFTDDANLRRTVKVRKIEDHFGRGEEWGLVSCLSQPRVEIKTTARIYDNVDGVLLETAVVNRSRSRVIEVGRISPFFIRSKGFPCLDLGGDFEDYKILVDSGSMLRLLVRNLSYDPLKRRYERELGNTAFQDWVEADNQHRSMGICAFFNPKTKNAFIVSFLTFNRARSEIKTEYDPGLVQSVSCESNFVDYELQPGQEIKSELLWISYVHDPLVGLETYAAAVKKFNRIKIKKAPVGWCSWYPKGYREKITEQKILNNARVISKHFSGFGIKWIQIDYGWNANKTPGEWLKASKDFPHGLKWLGRELQKLGFEMGLWYCPGLVTEHSAVFRKHPGWMLHDRQGSPALRHLDEWGWKPGGKTYDLDPTSPPVRNYLKKVFQQGIFWGSTFFKNDFLEQTSRTFVEHYDKKVVKGYETYRSLLKIIRKTVGPKVFLLGCSNLTNASLGLVDANRVTPDVGVSKGRLTEHFRSVYTTVCANWFLNGNFWINDPDVLVFEGSTLPEARIRATLIALSGGSIMLGDDMTKLVKNKKLMDIYKVCLPLYGRTGRPIDLFERDYPRIIDLPVNKNFGKWHLTAVFNLEEKKEKIVVDFAKLGLTGGDEYLVWEFWGNEFLGRHRSQIAIELAKTSVKLLLIKKVPDKPDVLSTDMHLTQGGVELKNLKWSESLKELSGTCCRPRGEKGHIFIYTPGGYRIKKACVGNTCARIQPVTADIFKMRLGFTQNQLFWKVSFV